MKVKDIVKAFDSGVMTTQNRIEYSFRYATLGPVVIFFGVAASGVKLNAPEWKISKLIRNRAGVITEIRMLERIAWSKRKRVNFKAGAPVK